MKDLDDKLVILKVSNCPICKGVVRVAVKHLMSKSSEKEFSKECFDYNLAIKEMPLLKYRKNKPKWCLCT